MTEELKSVEENEDEETVYNKLIRDKIPEIIRADGVDCELRTLDDKEYLEALSAKLIEEATEFNEAANHDEQIKELADIMEVVKTLQEQLNITSDEVEYKRIDRREQRGGFRKKLFLVRTRKK